MQWHKHQSTRQRVQIPKLGFVKCRVSREVKGRILFATISQNPSGKYFVSILVEEEQVELPKVEKSIGIDLGIKDLCTRSDGEKYENPKTIKRYEKKLTKLQRQLAHKEKKSKNYYKQRRKIALCHEKITNTRKDYLHKVSYRIISENQVIVSENLQIKKHGKKSLFGKINIRCVLARINKAVGI